jgi:N-acetylglucosaminyldiphosphoundecaprenol N-acetyl-beta-D-mannosaminyltransferase
VPNESDKVTSALSKALESPHQPRPVNTGNAWPFRQILGVKFFNGSVDEAVDVMCRRGGLLVVPAGPALVNIQYDEGYRRALLEADLAIADSGFMVLLWKILRRETVARISGLSYLKRLLDESRLRNTDLLFVVPTESAREKAVSYMRFKGLCLGTDNFYVAPRYVGQVEDARLAGIVNARRPAHIIMALGGGVQEKLGHYLRDNLSYRPAIYCTGAALGFLTGDQKPIPDWADRLYGGWLLRLGRNPQLYLRRFWVAHELPGLIFRHRENVPPLVPKKVESRSFR